MLFVPSVERDGATPVDQDYWADLALEMFGRVFGGATAYPKASGIWRDNERAGALVKDEPVVIHCYTTLKPFRTRTTWLSSAASVAGWVLKRIRVRSVWSSAMNTSPFASSRR